MTPHIVWRPVLVQSATYPSTMWRLYSDALDFLCQEEKRIYINIYRHFCEVEGGCYVAKIIFLFPNDCLFICHINASKPSLYVL